MTTLRTRTGRILAGLGATLALAVPMAAQADAATTTVRLHASTATGESLQGPSLFGTTVNLAPTNVNSSRQKWQKTDVGGGFATYKLVSSIGSSREMCLAASIGNTAPVRGDLQPVQQAAAVDARLHQRRPARQPQHAHLDDPSVQRCPRGALPRRRPGRAELARARRLISWGSDTGEGRAPSPVSVVAVRLGRTT